MEEVEPETEIIDYPPPPGPPKKSSCEIHITANSSLAKNLTKEFKKRDAKENGEVCLFFIFIDYIVIITDKYNVKSFMFIFIFFISGSRIRFQ